MSDLVEEIRHYEHQIRRDQRAILVASLKLALLWLPSVLGMLWAKDRVVGLEWQILHLKLSAATTTIHLCGLRKFGCDSGIPRTPVDDPRDGYDGWLTKDDRYRGGPDA